MRCATRPVLQLVVMGLLQKKVLRPKTWNLFWFVDPRHGTRMGGLCETYTQHAQIRALFCNFLGPQVAGNSLLFASDQLVDCGKMNVPLATAAVQVLVTYCTATACVGRAMVTQPGHQIDSVCIPFAYVLPHCWNQLVDMTWDFASFGSIPFLSQSNFGKWICMHHFTRCFCHL